MGLVPVPRNELGLPVGWGPCVLAPLAPLPWAPLVPAILTSLQFPRFLPQGPCTAVPSPWDRRAMPRSFCIVSTSERPPPPTPPTAHAPLPPRHLCSFLLSTRCVVKGVTVPFCAFLSCKVGVIVVPTSQDRDED